jgi:hypothetical protein
MRRMTKSDAVRLVVLESCEKLHSFLPPTFPLVGGSEIVVPRTIAVRPVELLEVARGPRRPTLPVEASQRQGGLPGAEDIEVRGQIEVCCQPRSNVTKVPSARYALSLSLPLPEHLGSR